MIVILSIFLPVLIYVFYGITKNHTRPNSSSQFYTGNKTSSISEYRDTTVAYSLQIAVTIYFIYWGYSYGWGNIFYIVSWYIGLGLFYFSSKKLIKVVDSYDTLFQFFKKIRDSKVSTVVSILTFLSLLGLVYVELFMTSNFVSLTIQKELGLESGAIWYWITFIALTFCGLTYTLIGGFKRVVITDKLQLSVAYIASASLIGAMFPNLIAQGFWTLFTIALTAIIVYLVLGLAGQNKGSSRAAHISWVLLMTWATVIVFLNSDSLSFSSSIQPKALLSQISEPWGWVSLVGFSLSNIVWQFSDYTAFHRLCALDLKGNEKEKIQKIQDSIKSTLIVSPLTWGIGILIGMSIYACKIDSVVGNDVFNEFVDYLLTTINQPYSIIALLALGLFLSSVLISTTDSIFLNASEIIEVDLLNKNYNLKKRYLLLLAIGFLIVILGIVHLIFQYDVLIFLNGIYSFTLVIAPITLMLLFNKRISSLMIIITLLSSIIVGFYFVIKPPEIHYSILLVLPTLAALSVSILLVSLNLVFNLFRK